MKVFISWSGEQSKLLATALKDWIQPILQSVEVWMSEADIDAGDRWGQEVARELSESNFGIICVTPENLQAPWVLFEAGALAKSLEGTKVIPLLFELELREISGPLAQFQAKKLDQSGLAEVASSVNKSLPQPITEASLKTLLDAMWPSIEQKIQAVPKRKLPKSTRSQAEILEELVSTVRGFDSRLKETGVEALEQTHRPRSRKSRVFWPRILDMVSDVGPGDPLGLLVFAGILRDDFPWLSEIFAESYRELRASDGRTVGRVIERIRKITFMTMRGPFLEELGSRRDSERLLMDMADYLGVYLSNVYGNIKADEPLRGEPIRARKPQSAADF